MSRQKQPQTLYRRIHADIEKKIRSGEWPAGARIPVEHALMAQYACLSLDAGARIIGGCCGTTPEHLRIMRRALEGHMRGPKPDLATIESRLGAISTGATAQLRGEMSREAGAAAGSNTRRTTGRRGPRVESN